MNIISIDPSLISTALFIHNGSGYKIFNYCRESDVYGKKGMTKWFKMAEGHIIYRFIEYRKFDNYSDGEIIKLKDYDFVTDMIISDILDNINPDLDTIIGCEGLSFSSSAGDIIDLSSFSTLLRKKLFDRVSENIKILSPSTLKLESCKLTYKPEIKEIGGKKPRTEYIYRNNNGIAGGKFTKTEMYLSIIENDSLTDEWTLHNKSIKDDILGISKIPKPYEDINDSFLLYLVLKNEFCK